MVRQQDLDEALKAHGQWKSRLEKAIEDGTSEFKPEVVRKDDACQFGQWLHRLSGEDTKSESYAKVKSLHTEFHVVAGTILQLALSGNKDDARKALAPGGDYQRATGKLVLALNGWKELVKE